MTMVRQGVLVGTWLIIMGLVGCTGTTTLEKYNRTMYQTNKVIDQLTLKPITKAYQAVTHDVIERRVNRFFNNIGEVGTLINSLLQGKLHNAAVSSSRLVWNTTLGLGGLFDVATVFGLKAHKEDFGQTLQTWGMPTGPYVVLPLLGPSTVTDAFGLVADSAIYPINRYDNWSSHWVRDGVIALNMVNTRAQLLPLEELLDTATTDEYLFVKSAYLQRRAALVRDGESDGHLDDEVDSIFDDLEEENDEQQVSEE